MDSVPLPAQLRGVFFDWRWETAKVWALPTPVSRLPLGALAWQLELTVWTTVPGKPRFDLSPATVLAHPDQHARHWRKIQGVDLVHPLELFRNGDRWVILDGYHRLARHWLAQTREIAVRLHPARCRDLIFTGRAGATGSDRGE